MAERERSPTNFERLLSHLQADTLAARLVSSQIDLQGQQPDAALKKIIVDRLEEVTQEHERSSDQVD